VILLFDIDGTLVRCGGAGKAALERAFHRLHGIEAALAAVRLDGSTDPVIVDTAFRARFGRSPTAAEHEALMADYIADLAVSLAARETTYRVLGGVHDLLAALDSARDRFVIGLATGNDERGARAKLAPADLNRYFAFGGYGSDHGDRAILVARGIERGQRAAKEALGRDVLPSEAWVFGDTELDVRAAHAAGARAVGVLAGSSNPEALKAAGPDLLIDGFDDRRLWTHLGLGDPPGGA